MVKYILLIMISIILSQDEYIYTSEEVLAIDNYITELEQSDSINVKIIEKLEEQIYMYIQQYQSDSLLIHLKNQEIVILDDQIENYKLMVEEVKPKWYEKFIHAGYGVSIGLLMCIFIGG